MGADHVISSQRAPKLKIDRSWSVRRYCHWLPAQWQTGCGDTIAARGTIRAAKREDRRVPAATQPWPNHCWTSWIHWSETASRSMSSSNPPSTYDHRCCSANQAGPISTHGYSLPRLCILCASSGYFCCCCCSGRAALWPPSLLALLPVMHRPTQPCCLPMFLA